MIEFILLVTLGYLMGSICSAVIVSRMFSLPDPRTEGSKNPGATNVLRLAGKEYAAGVILADILKGTIPVLIAVYLGAGPITAGFTGLAAVVGHMYPVFFQFKGGKGVATAIGVCFGLQFLLGVVVTAIWLLIANFTGYSSLASIVSICLAPLLALGFIGNVNLFPPLFFITLLVLYKHRHNITRLMDGVEPKIKLKSNILKDVMEPDATPKPVVAKAKAAEPVIPAAPAKKTVATKVKKPVKKAEPAKKPKAASAAKKPVKAKETAPKAKKTTKPKATKAKVEK